MGIELDRVAKLSKVAWRLYDERQYREAASVFRGLTVLDPENIDLYRGFALAASHDNDLLGATDALEQALVLLDFDDARDADRGQLLSLYAALLYRSGRRREAVLAAEESIEVSPPGAPWTQSLRQGIKRASTIIARTGGRAPSEAAPLRRVLRERLAEVGRGQATLARALGYGDKELMRVYENGAALLEQGQPDRAIRIFEGLVELDGGVPLFHLALGRVQEVRGEHSAAARAYSQAVRCARKVDGGDDLLGDALVRRARHAYKRGKKRAVVKDVKELMRLNATRVGEDLRLRALKLLRVAGGDPGRYATDQERKKLGLEVDEEPANEPKTKTKRKRRR